MAALTDADLGTSNAAADATPIDLDEIRLWPMRKLREVPRPAHLIAGVLIKGSLGVFVGRWGDGKTAVALDLAYRIANGESWCGRATLRGPVVYIAAEAADDVLLRGAAWDVINPNREHDVLVLPREVNLFSPAPRLPGQKPVPDDTVKQLYSQLDALSEKPVLIIFDTYAQCTVGSCENDAGDVGIVMRELKQLMRRYGCAVLLLHHPPVDRSQQRERGSGALVGAADVSIWIERPNDSPVVTLECKKSRRLAPFRPAIKLELEGIELPDGTTSVVAKFRGDRGANGDPPGDSGAPSALSETNRRALSRLAAATEGMLRTDLAEELSLSPDQAKKLFAALEKGGVARNTGTRKQQRWSITDAGRKAIGGE
jgi:KaiC/GvpD/RAD55 family RecA-like ATPase